MTDCLPSTWSDGRSNYISQAPACYTSKSTGAQKGHPRPDGAGTWYPRAVAILPQTLHGRSKGSMEEHDGIDNPGNMRSFLVQAHAMDDRYARVAVAPRLV